MFWSVPHPNIDNEYNERLTEEIGKLTDRAKKITERVNTSKSIKVAASARNSANYVNANIEKQETIVPVSDLIEKEIQTPMMRTPTNKSTDGERWISYGEGWYTIDHLTEKLGSAPSNPNFTTVSIPDDSPAPTIIENALNIMPGFLADKPYGTSSTPLKSIKKELICNDMNETPIKVNPKTIEQSKKYETSQTPPKIGQPKSKYATSLPHPKNNVEIETEPSHEHSINRTSLSHQKSNVAKESDARPSDTTLNYQNAEEILGEGSQTTLTKRLTNRLFSKENEKKDTMCFRALNLIRAIVIASFAINSSYKALQTEEVQCLGASPVYMACICFLALDIIVAFVKAFPKVLWICWDVKTWDPV
jgi:hypothetical protein